MEKLRTILKYAIPVLLLLILGFFGLTSKLGTGNTTVETGAASPAQGSYTPTSLIDSLNDEISRLKSSNSLVAGTRIIKVPVVVYVDRVVGIPIDQTKVISLEDTDYDLENSASDTVDASKQHYALDESKYLKLPYSFSLENEGISFDGEVNKDSFLMKNLLIQSPFTIQTSNSAIDKYREVQSVTFKYTSPFLQNLNIGYVEQSRITDLGLKKIKRQTALKSSAIAVGFTALSAFILKSIGVWK